MISIFEEILSRISYFKNRAYYNIDKKKYREFYKAYRKMENKEILEAIITQEYHAIEKGLIKKNFRFGYGKRAITQLLFALKKYTLLEFDKSNTRYLTGISVLHEYILKHKDTDVDNTWIKNELDQMRTSSLNIGFGGIETVKRSDILDASMKSFDILSKYRFSIRDYDDVKIDVEKIYKSLEIAQKTPSVCNRQGWKSRLILDHESIKQILELQGGFSGHGENIGALILITSLDFYYNLPREKNQGFIDSGMYSMSLLYSLTNQGLASCPINANLTLKNELEIRKKLNIKYNESLIMFITVGNYQENIVITKSKRDNYKEKLEIF